MGAVCAVCSCAASYDGGIIATGSWRQKEPKQEPTKMRAHPGHEAPRGQGGTRNVEPLYERMK